MEQALFLAGFDPVTRLPILPLKTGGDYLCFDGTEGSGWSLAINIINTPTAVPVWIFASSATITAHKADSSIVWICNKESS